MRRRFSSFIWKRGDVLILDNLKMAHNGMAGRGNRVLKVMLCNPVPLPSSEASLGLHVVVPSHDCNDRPSSFPEGQYVLRVCGRGGFT
jgi:hypothetical protein